MHPALEERYGRMEDVIRERVSHRHHDDPLRKDYLASHMREPHPYGFSSLNTSQLMERTTHALRTEHDRMHVGERCTDCGDPLNDGAAHFPDELGGGCIALTDESSPVACMDCGEECATVRERRSNAADDAWCNGLHLCDACTPSSAYRMERAS